MPLSDDPAEHPAVTLARWASFDHDTQVSLLVDSSLARGLCSSPNLTDCAVRAALDVAEGEDREYLARVVLTGAISMSLPVDLLQVCADCIVVDPTAWTLSGLTENLTRRPDVEWEVVRDGDRWRLFITGQDPVCTAVTRSWVRPEPPADLYAAFAGLGSAQWKAALMLARSGFDGTAQEFADLAVRIVANP